MLAAGPNVIDAARARYTEAATMARAQEVPMLSMRIALSETHATGTPTAAHGAFQSAKTVGWMSD